MGGSGDIRRPVVAGTFYPGAREELRAIVDSLLAHAIKTGPEPVALVSPHAGYVYSGHVAAEAFKQAEGVDYDALIVLGTNHTDPFGQGLAVWARGAFSTPLGDVPIDTQLAQALIDTDSRLADQHGPHLREHSIEVQLPFLQRVQPGKAFVPIVVCDTSLDSCQALADALVRVLRDCKALIVASSDLSHYPAYDDAVRSDRASLDAVLSLDPHALDATIQDTLKLGLPNLHTCMCGEGPIKTAMLYARAIGAKADVIKYANSGDVEHGNRWQVVGYGAVRFARSAPVAA
jgi:AmmeMemoRadiSam system protein B